MDDLNVQSLRQSLERVRRILQQPSSLSAPSGHDILNALHTVLCSIEMLEMDVTKSQREVFDRLELGAKHLDELLQAFIVESGRTKSTAVAQIDSALKSE